MRRGAQTRSRWRAAVAAALAAAIVLLGGAAGGQARGGGSFGKRLIASFDAPVYATTAPGVRNRLYVVERAGTVQALNTKSGDTHELLDIRDRVSTDGERGLLSIAFDPRFEANRLLYAYYTNDNGNVEIDEFRAPSNTQAGSRRTVLVVPHPGASNHNGGTIAFGPHGYLFAGTGDGGLAGDPPENAQSKGVLLGKILRIDPHEHGAKPYRSPQGNPFVGRRGRNEIFALGLRNPYRLSFDRGRVTIADVGQDKWEEVDYESRKSLRAANFGWDHFEGDHSFDYPGDNEAPRPKHHYERPIFEYRHGSRCGAGGCAITGGIVVRDSALGALRGRYLYADFYAGEIRRLRPRFRGARGDRRIGVRVNHLSSFAKGPHRRVYVTSLDGGLYRLVRR